MNRFDLITNSAGKTLIPVQKTDVKGTPKAGMFLVADSDEFFVCNLVEEKDHYGYPVLALQGGDEWETNGKYITGKTEALEFLKQQSK